MSTKPIGVYDSGIGGLTVLQALQRQLPYENFVYFADTAHLPYGDKTPQQIKDYSSEILTWMRDVADAKMVIAACHTSSAIALPALTSEFSVPVIGTILPLLEMVLPVKNPRIGILATPATAASHMHERIFSQYGFMGTITTIGCPGFVPLIEAGLSAGQLDIPLLQERAREYLQPFYTQKLNTLIYGCTHYPLIKSIIEPLLSESVLCIDPAEAIANQVAYDLKRYHLQNISGVKPSVRFECNADQAVFQRKVGLVFNSALPDIPARVVCTTS